MSTMSTHTPISTPDPLSPTKELLNNIFELVKMAIPDKFSDKADDLISQAFVNLDKASSAFKLQQQRVDELLEKTSNDDSKKQFEELQTKVNRFDGQLNRTKRENHNSQISSTKDNILVRTTKDAKAVNDHIVQLVKRGSNGGNLKCPDFVIHLISTSSDPTKSPNKRNVLKEKMGGRVAGAPPSQLYKVFLGPHYKDLLFKGLARKQDSMQTRNNSDKAEKSEFSISHDTPLFLRKNRVTLEQCAYSLRKSLKEKCDIRTKVVLKDQNLRLYYNTKEDRTWVAVMSSSASGEIHQAVQDTMYLAAKEGDPQGTKKVPEVISNLTTF